MRLLTEDEIVCMTGYQEARGEVYESLVAVLWTIRNRKEVKTGGPNLGTLSDGTYSGTCLRYGQFSGWHFKDPNFKAAMLLDDQEPSYQRVAFAWDKVKGMQKSDDPTKGGLFYYNPKAVTHAPVWLPYVDLTATLGNHCYYRPKG
jgi:hypothetical protein